MIIKFKPMLCPNEKVNLETIKFPVLDSNKLDGIRGEFHNELGLVSRSLKPIQNKQLQEKFQPVLDHVKKYKLILDGEFYCHYLNFQVISSLVMTQDFETDKKYDNIVKNTTKEIKGEWTLQDRENAKTILSFYTGSTPRYIFNNPIEFYAFDTLTNVEGANLPFEERYKITRAVVTELKECAIRCVVQTPVNSVKEIEDAFEICLHEGYEGLILKDPKGKYKFGRGTIKEALCFKVKPFETFDAKIIGVKERFENTNESFKNELGRSTKRNTLDAKQGTGIASCFIVKYLKKYKAHENPIGYSDYYEIKPVITGTEEFRKEIWDNKESYIGKMIEYKAMMIGAKDVPRHPIFLRFREDRD